MSETLVRAACLVLPSLALVRPFIAVPLEPRREERFAEANGSAGLGVRHVARVAGWRSRLRRVARMATHASASGADAAPKHGWRLA